MKLNSLSRVFHISKGEFMPHSLKKPNSLSRLAQIDNEGIELTRCRRMPMPPAGTIAFRQPHRVKSVWLHASQEMIVLGEEEKAL
ncbi:MULTISPECIES: hypothetical protein [unclassified Symbiopectobacterium]|uniref:hypothetical protein n=1 Tax=unclassified Symbiopectobacterium TaxID=2794573 RepID=UPI002227E9CD|nr:MULTISPECIES: hypothetical protein [unclassified Symbiopectobacterium]MCW2476490.1 hypothetical protein [Candidatus Symbiopectobacterium sp. NZEC151]MCW2487860.1 hypothetical protein [Candidatus Symbiopectobacterium sp. NZEC127]